MDATVYISLVPRLFPPRAFVSVLMCWLTSIVFDHLYCSVPKLMGYFVLMYIPPHYHMEVYTYIRPTSLCHWIHNIYWVTRLQAISACHKL